MIFQEKTFFSKIPLIWPYTKNPRWKNMNFQKKYHFELALYAYKERVTEKMHFLLSVEFSASLPWVAWSPDATGYPVPLGAWTKSLVLLLSNTWFFAPISFCIFKLPAIVQSVQKVGCKQEEIMYREQLLLPAVDQAEGAALWSELGNNLRLGGKYNFGLGSNFLNFPLNYCPAKLISWPDVCEMDVYHISRAWDDLLPHQKVHLKPLCMGEGWSKTEPQ